jgi:hypothetical protein
MTGFVSSMRFYKRQHSAILSMIGAMTTPLIEQNKTFLLKQRVHFGKADAAGAVFHPLDNFITLCHAVHATFRN